MKHILSFLLAVLLLLTFALAHSGGTDGQGGHIDHSSGEYHFHHGYPAHQHPNGTCIYEFDDKTGQNSGTPGGGGYKTTQKATTKVPTTRATTAITTTTMQHDAHTLSPFEQTLSSGLLFLLISGFWFSVIYFIILFIVDCYQVKKQKKINEEQKRIESERNRIAEEQEKERLRIESEQRRIAEENARFQRFQSRRDFLYEIFGDDISKIDLDAIPDDISFTPSVLPIKGIASETHPYGSYTVFTTDSGKKYHKAYLCCNASHPHHLFIAWLSYTPCSKCFSYIEPKIPDWYQQIIDLYRQHKYNN